MVIAACRIMCRSKVKSKGFCSDSFAPAWIFCSSELFVSISCGSYSEVSFSLSACNVMHLSSWSC